MSAKLKKKSTALMCSSSLLVSFKRPWMSVFQSAFPDETCLFYLIIYNPKFCSNRLLKTRYSPISNCCSLWSMPLMAVPWVDWIGINTTGSYERISNAVKETGRHGPAKGHACAAFNLIRFQLSKMTYILSRKHTPNDSAREGIIWVQRGMQANAIEFSKYILII